MVLGLEGQIGQASSVADTESSCQLLPLNAVRNRSVSTNTSN